MNYVLVPTFYFYFLQFQSEIFLSSCNLCCDQYIKTQMSSGGRAGKPKEEEQDGMSVHSPCKPPPSSASSLPKVSLSLWLCLKFEFGLELTSGYGDRSNHRLNWSWDCWKLLRFTLQWGYKVVHMHVCIHAHAHIILWGFLDDFDIKILVLISEKEK